jgi:hypothetical protein
VKKGTKDMSSIFKKIAHKNQQKEDPNAIENQVISLGMVESLSKQISVNELAAKGIVPSIKLQLIDFIKKSESQVQSN